MVVVRRVRGRVGEDDAHAEYASRVLIRSWNLFHGRTLPAGRDAVPRADDRRSRGRSRRSSRSRSSPWAARAPRRVVGLTAAVRRRRRPVASATARTARDHRLDPNRLRSAVEGQANAILVAPGLGRSTATIVLNARGSGGSRASWVGLRSSRLIWAERAADLPGGSDRPRGRPTAIVANLHATSYPTTSASPDAEADARRDLRRRSRRPGERVRAGRRLQRHGGDVADAARARDVGVGLLAGGPRDRPRPRPGPHAEGPELATGGGRPPATRAFFGPIMRPWSSRSMTFEEARAQFPVLERYAYLNAGTFGPMATRSPTRSPRQPQRSRRADQPGGFEQFLDSGSASARVRAMVRRRPGREHRAHDVDVGGLQRRAERARPRRGRRDRHDRLGALRRDRAARRRLRPPSASRGFATGRPTTPTRRSSPRSARGPKLIALSHVPLDQRAIVLRGASCARRPACPCSSTGRSRSARSRSTRPAPTSTPSPPRSGSAVRTRPARSRCGPRRAAPHAAELPLPARVRPPNGTFEPRGRRPLRHALHAARLDSRSARRVRRAPRVALRARRRERPRVAATSSSSAWRSSPSRATRTSSRSADGDGPRAARSRGSRRTA